MDIVYIVGKTSPHDFLELKLSLRSIARYGTGIGRVIVAGYIPDFVGGDGVVKFPVEDKYKNKHSNILNCIERLVDEKVVTGEFLYSSDDHFYVRDVDFDHYPFYYKCDYLPDAVDPDDTKHRRYHWSMVYTKRILEMARLQYRCYALHCNTHMSAETFAHVRDLVRYSYWTPFGVEPTCLLMNARLALHPDTPIEKRRDTKLEWADTEQEIRDTIGELDCISCADSAFECPTIMAWFKEMFGTRCRYEQGGV